MRYERVLKLNENFIMYYSLKSIKIAKELLPSITCNHVKLNYISTNQNLIRNLQIFFLAHKSEFNLVLIVENHKDGICLNQFLTGN